MEFYYSIGFPFNERDNKPEFEKLKVCTYYKSVIKLLSKFNLIVKLLIYLIMLNSSKASILANYKLFFI